MAHGGAALKVWLLAGAAALAGCAGGPPTAAKYSPADARALIERSAWSRIERGRVVSVNRG